VRLFNFRSDLFATTICFFLVGVIKLVSSVVLTRILYPEAYGIVILLSSVVFALEMLSDIGVTGFVIRDKNGGQRTYIDTIWTLRLIRCGANAVLLFAAAPYIAQFYDSPALTGALRVFSAWFVLQGLESLSFPLAIRDRRARIPSYADLVCTLLSTVFAVAYSYVERDHFGMVYGMVFHRMLMSALSYRISPYLRPRFRFSAEVAKHLFGFSKFVFPSSLISLVLAQFDKVVFLKLFDLHLLGLYGIAANIALPVDTLTAQISRHVLLARCSDIFRTDPNSLRIRYYRDNIKLFMLVLLTPAVLAGSSKFLVDLLYDDRYAFAAVILQAFMLRSILLSLSGPAENLLVAAGGGRVVLAGNLFRLAFLPGGALLGYFLGGFEGFILGVVLSEAPALGYFLWQQKKQELLIVHYELLKLLFIAGIFAISFAISTHLSGLAVAFRHHVHP